MIAFPAAEVPVLETILDIDGRRLIPFNADGDYCPPMRRPGGDPGAAEPLNRVELRVRSPLLTELSVSIDGASLTKVTDTASHPELLATGYFRLGQQELLSRSDPLAFSRVLVVLPGAKRAGTSDLHLAVRDLSLNPKLSGTAKESDPLQITLRSFNSDRCIKKPSNYFFSGDNQKHPGEALIASDVTVAGWIANSLDRGGNDNGSTEDVHFELWLDPDFIARNYGFVHTLDGAIIPGRPFSEWDKFIHNYVQIPFTGGGPVTASMFLMPGKDTLNNEQNTWHRLMRGDPPAGWVQDPVTLYRQWILGPRRNGFRLVPDDYYAQSFWLPSKDWAFQVGDYVKITGALVEDTGHLHFKTGAPADSAEWTNWCWDHVSKGNGGWLELHPFDAIHKVRPPSLRKHLQLVQLCSLQDGSDGSGLLPSEFNSYLSPMDAKPPTPNSVLRFEETIDPRFSDMTKVPIHTVEVSPCDSPRLYVHVKVALGGHFMATYKLWWEEGDQPRPACSSDRKPNPRPKDESPKDESLCSKKPYLPQCGPRN